MPTDRNAPYYTVDILHENETPLFKSVQGIASPRDAQFNLLDNNNEYLFFTVKITPSTNYENLQVLKMVLSQANDAFQSIFLTPVNMMYETNAEYTMWFRYSTTATDSILGGTSQNHLVSLSFPYKLSC
jgi:hypothetical protein